MRTNSPTPLDDDVRFARRLAGGFWALLCLTTGLLVLGALVRAHGAGLACPDWPLCFGQVVPEFDLKVAFEWGHRLVAGSVSILFVGLGIPLLRRPFTRSAHGRAWIVAAVILVVQVILGALTVWQLLAQWTVTSHLVTGNAFNVALLYLALGLGDTARPGATRPVTSATRAWVTGAALLLGLQMILGGLVSSSYAGLACADWPSCNDGVWFPSLHGPVGLQLAHRMNGYALVCLLVGAAITSRRGADEPGPAGWCALALILAGVQVGVGVANVLQRLPVEITGLHSALAAGIVLAVAGAVRGAWRTRS